MRCTSGNKIRRSRSIQSGSLLQGAVEIQVFREQGRFPGLSKSCPLPLLLMFHRFTGPCFLSAYSATLENPNIPKYMNDGMSYS